MKTFNKIFLTALFSGAIAGLLLAGLQHFTVIPMIIEAETYEVAGDDASHEASGEGNNEVGAADHGKQAWAPEEGAERTFYTATNSVIIGIGFGLLLVACYALRGSITWQKGLVWGLAGFAAFHLAPSFGLPAELPGDAAADLEQRQVWWLLTVVLTAIGLWIIAFQPNRYLKLFGVALIALPHVFGAPQPATHQSLAPEDLRIAFHYTSLTTNAIFWAVLGLVSAYLFNRFDERAEKRKVVTATSS